jgi:RNA-dependent RNA polymerase
MNDRCDVAMPQTNRPVTPEIPHQPKNGSQWQQSVARKWKQDLKTPYTRLPVAKPSMEPDGWQNWPELGLKLYGLPLDIEASQLWGWFKDEGDIELIKIYDVDQMNPREVTAKVVFRPPPKRAFWAHGVCTVQHPDRSRFPDGLNLSVAPPLESTQPDHRLGTSPGREPANRLLLHPESISFGAPIGQRGVKFMRTIQSRANDDLQLQFDSRSGNFLVQFLIPASAGTWRGTREYKFTVHVSQMRAIYSSASQHGEMVTLVLPLRIPPRYFWKRDDMRATLTANKKFWNPRLLWSRATNVCAEIQNPLRYPVALLNDIDDPEYIDIGRLTTFRFCLRNQSEEQSLMIEKLQGLLQHNNVVIENYENLHLIEEDNKSMWDHLKHHQLPKSENSALALLESTNFPDVYLPFEVYYQLEVCVSRGILSEYMIRIEFLRKLAGTGRAKAKLILEYLADEGRPVFEPMTVFRDPKADAYVTNTRIPQHCTLTYRAVITPTTIRFDSPNAEPSNRVTRRYNHIQDRFLRVSFLEESEKESIRKYQQNNDAIYTRVMRALYQGIQIGERHYEFLAFGNSQIKECSCYFFCPTEHISCDNIRSWMGQFDHIKVVAKYAARIGQCFSSTLEIKGVQTPTVREIGDIERNGYCFTDGVGVISNFLARMIIDEMGLDVFDEPSAFQFRMGGRKGVLTVWPNASKMEVHIRKSQEKFTSNYNGLEIIRCARMATATLNRQTIAILENLGVRPSVFLNLLDQQIKRFESAMSDTKIAIDVLMQYIDENGTTMIMAELLKAGFTDEGRHEPFVTSILSLWRSWSLKMLKEKTRIKVEQSAFVLGCVDETGTLRGHSFATEGSREKDPDKLPQIFLQLSDPKAYKSTKIIKGICIVGRNPSLHAGDIRVVQAVDVAELRHLKDVVVFPSTGDRPVPNMLSGGDLDGDDFFVIWDERLIPQEWNHPPMNFTPEKPCEVADGVTVDNIRDFFVSYIKNDVLGLVATSHLAHADKSGIRSPLCKY